MKKVLSLISAMALLATMTACGGDESSEPASSSSKEENSASSTVDESSSDESKDESSADDSGEQKTINLWAFTEEVPGMMDKYIKLNPDFGKKYKIEKTVIATTNGEYQPALDAALNAGGKDAPDIYCAEAAFILKYTQGSACQYAASYKDLGLDVDAKIEEAQIAPYSVEIGTNPSGDVVGLGYQATGGAFIYRRSIANDVFGSDDPKKVGEAIGSGTQSLDKFWEAAETLKGKGYGIISGDGDLWHAVENSSDSAWIVDGKLNIDSKREAFLDYSKKLIDNKYHNDTTDWTDAWFADMKDEGEKKIFGFFGPAWLINYTIGQNCGDTAGDWAVCAPPVGFFWGGTWLLANKDSSVKEGVGEFINWVTLDSSETGLQYMWANGSYDPDSATKDAVASSTVMANSDGSLEFLGGQNMFDVFVPANEYANGKNLSEYDETINSFWRDQVRMYSSGQKSKEDAIKDFKQNVADNIDIEVEF